MPTEFNRAISYHVEVVNRAEGTKRSAVGAAQELIFHIHIPQSSSLLNIKINCSSCYVVNQDRAIVVVFFYS